MECKRKQDGDVIESNLYAMARFPSSALLTFAGAHLQATANVLDCECNCNVKFRVVPLKVTVF
jgi:hypothetical protein